MPSVDTTKRLREAVLQDDIKALRGAKGFENYVAFRPEARISFMCELEEKMRIAQEAEIQAKAQYRALLDTAQQAEWDFHNAVLSMKKSVLAQYGDDSNEAEAVGYVKKSARKRPQRSTPVESASA
ncbi:hypothetical protein ACQ4M3_32155 [Leptolyngbya sp. AN03gr2]|uniref:hypothetical protein n=1 Tax=unclassified Leptolyngbya TaxID=2650499 RepID=UPI003D321143